MSTDNGYLLRIRVMWEVYNGRISSARSILESAISGMMTSREGEVKNKADVKRIKARRSKKRKTAEEVVVEGLDRKKRKTDRRDKGEGEKLRSQ